MRLSLSISRTLKKLGYTRKSGGTPVRLPHKRERAPRKKRLCYQQRSEEARLQFKRQLEQYSDKKVIYLDESGINNNESYPYGWSKKGKRFYSFRPGQRQERLSIIGALCEEKFFAPMVYQGYCKAQVIEVWLEKVLLPLVVAPSIIRHG